RLRDVLADDGRVADVPITEPELVVGEPDRPRVVGALRLTQRAAEQRDAARGFAAGDSEPAVQAPQLRETRRMQPFPLLARLTEVLRRLSDVVLRNPRLRQRAADLEVLVACESRLLQRANEQRRGFGAVSLLEGVRGLREVLWHRHRREYTAYTPRWIA